MNPTNSPAVIYTYSADNSAPRQMYGPFPSIVDAVDWAAGVLGPETDDRRWDTATLAAPIEGVIDLACYLAAQRDAALSVNEQLRAELTEARRSGLAA